MIPLENTLCATCRHLIYCGLTDDKGFIWSCSDYDASGVGDFGALESDPTGTDGFSTSDNSMTLV